MRALARETAFKLIFERLFIKESYTFDEEFFALLKKDEDKQFAKDIVVNYEQNQQNIKEIISNHLIGYEIDRVFRVDLALICEALTEILYLKTPYQVAINEVCNLAKKYSTERSSRFINGVCASIVKDINKDSL